MAVGWAAAIGAGASLLGDMMSASGQQNTNAMNMAMMQQNEAWQTQMSDTAMQRRVTDLTNAGLNPLLAVGTPGATVPGVSQPMMQNPQAAFGNLGSQVSSAMQLQTQSAQIAQMQAQAAQAAAGARKTDAETDTVLPAQVKQIQAQTGLTSAQSTKVSQEIQLLDFSLAPGSGDGRQSIAQMEAQQGLAQSMIRTHVMQMDQQTQQDTMLTLIRARNDANFAAAIGAQNISSANDTEFGRLMAYFHLGAPAVSAAGAAARFIP